MEAGIRPYRLWFARETTDGEAPTDPSWLLYSDRARTVEPVLNPQAAAQMGLGEVDPDAYLTATEQHQFTVAYDLQQWIVDGSGNALDALYDAVQRDSENAIPNSHTIVRRIDQSGISADNTHNGSTAKDTRQFYVAKGAKPNATITGDPSSPDPDLITLEYEAEKGRLYQIDQPESAKQIALQSTDASDTGVTVSIEGTDDTDSDVSEDVTLDGSDATTLVDSDTSFKTIAAIELGSETTGDVEVYADDDNTNDTIQQGDQLSVIYGSGSYDHGEGDLGVPTTGSGSEPSAIGSEYAIFHQDTVKDGAGNAIADNIVSTEGSVDNNWATPTRGAGPRRTIVATNRTGELSATVYGELEHLQHTVDALRSVTDHVDWTFVDSAGTTLGTLRWQDAQVTETGATEEAGQGVKEVELTMNSAGLVVDP